MKLGADRIAVPNAADMKDGDLDLADLLSRVGPLPIRGEGSLEPEIVERHVLAEHRVVDLRQRQSQEGLEIADTARRHRHIGLTVLDNARPPSATRKHKRAMVPRDVACGLGWAHLRDDRFERGMLVHCCRPLHRSEVASADHAHIAIAPRLLHKPIERVFPVGDVGIEWIEMAIAAAGSAHILHHDDIAALRVELAQHDHLRSSPVRCSHQDDRILPITVGTNDVHHHPLAISHGCSDARLADSLVRGLAELGVEAHGIDEHAFEATRHAHELLHRNVHSHDVWFVETRYVPDLDASDRERQLLDRRDATLQFRRR